jgi:hypothetical protein
MRFLLLILLSVTQAYAQFGTATTIEEVESFVLGKKIGTVEQFLEALDDEQKSRYVLMYDSKSLQSATFQKPRVIMFSQTAEILFSFNGDGSQKNGNKIEMILFDRKNSRFRAHEIEFTGKSAVVKKDPQICMSCHGTDLRPNWNHYNFWEGAYGSNDAQLTKVEYKEMKKFEKTYEAHPRYRHLGNVPERFNVWDQPERKRMKNLDIFDLTKRIFHLNFLRIKRILIENSQYDKVKYPFLSLFGMCDPDVYERLLPEGYFEKIHPGFIPLNVDYDFDREAQNDEKREQLLNSVGIDTTFLSTEFGNTHPPESISMIFKSKFTTPGTYQFEFAYILSKDDPDLKPFVTVRDPTDGDKQSSVAQVNCGKIKYQSSKVIGLKLTPVKPVLDLGKQVFEHTCLRCHKTDALAGFAFTEEDLKRELQSRPELIKTFRYRLSPLTDESERMPLNMKISPEERRAVQAYIEKFL